MKRSGGLEVVRLEVKVLLPHQTGRLVTEVVRGSQRGPARTIGSLQVILGTARTRQQEVTELSLGYFLDLKRKGRVFSRIPL